MNYESIEGLNNSEILELYDGIIEGNIDIIGSCICYHYSGASSPCKSYHCDWGSGVNDFGINLGGCEQNINSHSLCSGYWCSSKGGHFYHSYHWNENCVCRGNSQRTWSTCK